MEALLVSVVIVTWNRKADVMAAVQSIYDQAYEHVEIIVVDNGSTDGTAEALRRAYPGVRLIGLGQNLGAAAGRSAGLDATRGDVIFTLDSDAILAHDTLTRVVAKLQEEPEVGIITCKIVNTFTGELDAWIFTEKDKADQDRTFLSYSFCSAGSAIRKEVIDRVGAFWDMLFIYCEEDDLSLRVWDAGYKILYLPEALVYHRASPEKRVTHAKREYFDLRNSLYIYLVRYPWWLLLLFAPLQVGISLVKGIRRGCVRLILLALLDVVRQGPGLWRQRRPISNRTARYYLRLQREHGPLRWDLVSWLKYKT